MPNDFSNVISRNKSYFKYDVENPSKGVLKELHVLELNQIYVNFYLILSNSLKFLDSMYS